MAGPPGIDFFTYPELRNLSDYMAFWNIDPNDNELLSLYRDHYTSMTELDAGPILEVQHRRLRAMLEERSVREARVWRLCFGIAAGINDRKSYSCG